MILAIARMNLTLQTPPFGSAQNSAPSITEKRVNTVLSANPGSKYSNLRLTFLTRINYGTLRSSKWTTLSLSLNAEQQVPRVHLSAAISSYFSKINVFFLKCNKMAPKTVSHSLNQIPNVKFSR